MGMDVGAGTLLIGGAIGLALTLFGVRMLVTGRTTPATERAFRTVRDAGLYYLLFGIALLLLVAGTELAGAGSLPGAATAGGSAVVAVVLVAVAVIRYRPRRSRPADVPPPAARSDVGGKNKSGDE
jgi:hypothetical protein